MAAADQVVAVVKDRREKVCQAGLSPDVAEQVWRQMITAFIDLEQT